jgi:hypothetical protein
VDSLLNRHMIPLMKSMYEGTVFDGKSDPFVVRYIMTGQYELEPHQDSSVVTSVVTLSNEFEGGGVTFRATTAHSFRKRWDWHCFIQAE